MTRPPEINLSSDWDVILRHAARILDPAGMSSEEKRLGADHTQTVIRVIVTKRLADAVDGLDTHLQQAAQMLLKAADAAERAEAARHEAIRKQSARLVWATWALFGATVVMAFATIALVRGPGG